MTQEAKKIHGTHSEKKHLDNETIINTVHGIREGVETFKRTADEFNRKAAEGFGMSSENISAILNSGAVAPRICMKISKEIIENCNRTASEFSEMSQEALACRTARELMDVQIRSSEQLSRSYFDMANNISRIAFDAWAEALAPVMKRADNASKQMRKAA